MNEDFDMNEWDSAGILSQDRSQISPFIVRNILAKQFDKMTVILLEYSNLGTLVDLINTQKDLPIPMIRVILRQILQGLSYIHSKGIIHRDIKGGNILMHSPPGSGRVILKIADFGEMKNAQNDLQKSIYMSQRGTNAYMAPDLFLANANNVTKADSKVDMWSLGMLLYQITTHTFPYNPHNEYEIQQFMWNRVLIRPPSITDNNLWNLLKRMLEFDRKVRISAPEALSHPFFTINQAQQEITKEQLQLAQASQINQRNGNLKITQFDINPNFIIPLIE
ncbi:MAG: putative CAMK family protein kinase, partial [Streblomastix strix]